MKEDLLKEMEEELKSMVEMKESAPCYTIYKDGKILCYISDENMFEETVKNIVKIMNLNFDMFIFSSFAEIGDINSNIILIIGIDKESNYRLLNIYDNEGNLLFSFENEEFDEIISKNLS